MSIAIHMIEGRFCPLVTCDTCAKRITDPTMAAVVFEMNPSTGTTAPRFVHKGRCHEAMDARMESPEGYRPGWNELHRWMADLMHNVGLHGEAWTAAVEHSEAMHEVGL
jgi:hypothetical protein